MRVSCPNCPVTAEVELSEVHEQDRVCWECKSPWVPEGYDGKLIVENQMVYPADARAWMATVPDTAGHWMVGGYARYIRRYTGLLRSGVWESQLIGHPGAVEHAITFDCHGVLLIGVLRLIACIESGFALDAVVRTFDPIIPGHVDFAGNYKRRADPSVLNYWKRVRECSPA